MIIKIINKISYETQNLDLTPEKKYFHLLDNYPDVVKAYPLPVKYICFYSLYCPDLMEKCVYELDKVPYEKTFAIQADYVKKLLVKNGIQKGEAKKISNLELEEIEKQINKIKKQEIQHKKKVEQEKKEFADELRSEFLEFVLDKN